MSAPSILHGTTPMSVGGGQSGSLINGAPWGGSPTGPWAGGSHISLAGKPQTTPDLPGLFTGPGLIGSLYDSGGDPSKDYWKYGLNDQGGRSPANIAAERLAPAEYWNLANQYAFYNQLQPEEQQSVQQYINYMQHPELMSDAYRQGQQGAAQNALPGLQNSILSAGGGQGAKEGAALAVGNQANRASSSYDAQLYSPLGQAQRMQGIIGAYQSQNPNWNNMGNIASITNNTPRNATGAQVVGAGIGGILSGIGGIIGATKGSGGGSNG